MLLSVKIFIAGVGLWYVISQISWHDRVFVSAGSRIRGVAILDTVPVRLLNWQNGMPRVLLAGQKLTVRLATGRVVTGAADRSPINWPRVVSLPLADLAYAHGRLEIRRGLFSLIRSAKTGPLLAALLLLGLPTFITTWRWRKLLAVQGLYLTYGKCLTLTFVGQFYSTFLPGHSGGDVMKIIYTGRMTAQPTKSAVAVLLDRTLGLVTLLIVAMLAIILLLLFESMGRGGGVAATDPMLLHILWVIGGLLGVVCAVGMIYFYGPLRRRLKIGALMDRLPTPDFIKHADQTLQVYREHTSLLALLVLVTMCSQSGPLLASWFIGKALGMHASFGCYIAYISIVALALSLPIVPPGGLGVLDMLLLYFFVTRGVDSANQAFALAQGLRFLPLFWTMVGAYWVVGGKFPRPREEVRATRATED